MKKVYLEGDVFWLMKNGPPTFHRVFTKTFREYLDNFMKIFLDNFIVYNDTNDRIYRSLDYAFKNARST
jgi:hypothetical protein